MTSRVRRTHDRAGGRRSELRWAFARLGEPAALSQPVALLYLPFGAVGPLVVDSQRLGGDLADWLVIALASQVALMVAFALAHRVVFRPGRDRRRPMATIVAIWIAVTLRAFVLGFLTFRLGMADTLELPYRVGSALIIQAGFLAVLAMLVSAFERIRAMAGALEAQRVQLAAVNESLLARIDETEAVVVSQVRRLIDPLIRQIDGLATRVNAASGSDSASIRESIRALVDDELRPLSHRLASAESTAPTEGWAEAVRPVTVPLPERAAVPHLLNPAWSGILLALIAASQVIREPQGGATLAFPVISGVLMWAVLRGVGVLTARWVPRLWLGILMTALFTGVAAFATIEMQRMLHLPVPAFIGFGALLIGGLLGALMAGYSAVTDQREATEEQLCRSIEELAQASSALRQRAFLARRQLSLVIHGSVQSALHAAALRLAAHPEPTPQLIDSIHQDIVRALAKLDDPLTATQLVVDTLGELTDLWRDTCNVGWTMSHRTVRSLAESTTSAVSVAEIAREAVSNAVRHGRASQVTISIVADDGIVVLTIDDDGTGLDPSRVTGLGSRMFDELCVSWSRERVGETTRLTCSLPLVADAGVIMPSLTTTR